MKYFISSGVDFTAAHYKVLVMGFTNFKTKVILTGETQMVNPGAGSLLGDR